MNSPLSGDRNMLTTRSEGATLHGTCTIYGGENYSWDESVGSSFLRLNKGANVIRGRPEAPARDVVSIESSVVLDTPIRQESQAWRLPDCRSCTAEVGGPHRMTIHRQ
jgi:hypothetical protein